MSILRVEFFGGLRVTVKDAVDAELTLGFSARLLAYLALNADSETNREVLCELLWEGIPLESSRQSLRQALHELRRLIEPPPIEKDTFLIATRNSLRLNAQALSTDIADFDRLIVQTTLTTSMEEKAGLYASALALVKGEFLSGYYDEWIVEEQTRLTNAYDCARLDYLRILEVLGRTEEAVALANQILAGAPCQEEVHCTLMRLYTAKGHSKLVQRQADRLRQCLEAEGLGAPQIATDVYIENLLQLARQSAPAAKAPAAAEESAPVVVAPASQPAKWRKEYALLLLPLVVFLILNRAHPSAKTALASPDKQIAKTPLPEQAVKKEVKLPLDNPNLQIVSTSPQGGAPKPKDVESTGKPSANTTKPAPLPSITPPPKVVPELRTEDRKPLWVAYFENSEGDVDSRATVVKTDGQGNIYVGGVVKNKKTDVDFVILKYAPIGGKRLWEKRFDAPDHDCDRVVDMAVDTDGNVYVTGDSNSWKAHNRLIYDPMDIVTIKYDTNGEKLWEKRYDPSNGGRDYPIAIAVDKTGNVYVAGTSTAKLAHQGWDGTDIVVVKYNSSGDLKWEGRYNGPHRRNDKAMAMAVDDAGNAYVTGSSMDNLQGLDWVTMKFDSSKADGNPDWAERLDGTSHGDDIPRALALGKSGSVYVTGSAGNHGARLDYLTVKYENNGSRAWCKQYNGTAKDDDIAVAIALDAEENVYVTGESDGLGTDRDYATLKYLGSNGNEEWVARENGTWSKGDVARKVVVGKTGNVYVTGAQYGGYSNKGGTEMDIATVCYPPINSYPSNMNKAHWKSVFTGKLRNGSEEPFAMTVDKDGNIIVAGQSDTGKSHDIVVMKYAP